MGTAAQLFGAALFIVAGVYKILPRHQIRRGKYALGFAELSLGVANLLLLTAAAWVGAAAFAALAAYAALAGRRGDSRRGRECGCLPGPLQSRFGGVLVARNVYSAAAMGYAAAAHGSRPTTEVLLSLILIALGYAALVLFDQMRFVVRDYTDAFGVPNPLGPRNLVSPRS